MGKLILAIRSFLDDLPLRPTIAMALVIGLSGPVVVSVWRDLAERRETLLANLAEDHDRIAEVVAIGMQQPIWEVRPDTGRPLLEAVMRDPRVVTVSVSSPLIPRFLAESVPERRRGERLFEERPVLRNGDRIGFVTVEMSTFRLDEEIVKNWLQVLATGGLQLMFGMLLLYPLVRWKVLNPVGRLVKQAEGLAAGALDQPLDWRRNDEMGRLGRRFEETRVSLARLVDDLETRNEELAASEADLGRRQRILRAILENMTDGITMVDEDRRLVRWNDRFLQIMDLPKGLVRYGMSIEELVEYDLARGRFPESDRQEILDRVRQSYGPEVPTSLNYVMADGQHINIRRRRMPGGGTVSTYTDVTAQVEARTQADQTLRLLLAVMDAVPAVVHVKNRHLCYEYVNKQFPDWWDIPRAHAIGRTNAELFPPEMFEDGGHFARTEERDRAVLETGEPISFYEGQKTRADGKTISTWTTKLPLADADGAICHVLTLDFDITERKQIEEERRRWLALFQDAVESIPNGFAIYDPTDNLVACNSAYAALYGKTPDELRGINIYDIMSQFLEKVRTYGGVSGEEALRGLTEAVAASQRATADITEVELLDGRWFLVTGHSTAEGGFVWLRSEITDYKRMQERLIESEQRFRGIVEAAADAIISAGPDGRVTEFNPAAERVFGIARPAAIGRTVSELIVLPPAWRADHDAGMTRLAAGDESRLSGRTLEAEALRASGETFPVEITISQVPLEGRPLFTAFIRDITERRKSEAELARHREALHQREKLGALGALLAGVAHELNNPLSVVIGRSIMLEEKLSGSPLAESVERLRSAAERCARIVKTFLAMARQEQQVRTRVALDDVVRAALDLTEYGLRTGDVEIDVDMPPDLPEVDADPDQLTQVFVNLFVNAGHAMAGAGGEKHLRIAADAGADGETLVVRVADTGPGVTPDILPRIFEPFFTTKPVGEGTGLGLSVSEGIVRAHGGDISAEPVPGGGLGFRIVLPAAGAAAGAEPVAGAGDGGAAGGDGAALVVDDEPEVARMLADILAADGMAVEIAETGRVALDRLAGRDFDIVFSDLRMPDLDGPGLYEALKSTRPDLARRTVFVTGDTLSPVARRFLAEANRPVIEKPFVPDDVRRAVREVRERSGD